MFITFAHLPRKHGIVAEWLGSALQKLLQRFESARYLSKKSRSLLAGFFFENGAVITRFTAGRCYSG